MLACLWREQLVFLLARRRRRKCQERKLILLHIVIYLTWRLLRYLSTESQDGGAHQPWRLLLLLLLKHQTRMPDMSPCRFSDTDPKIYP